MQSVLLALGELCVCLISIKDFVKSSGSYEHKK